MFQQALEKIDFWRTHFGSFWGGDGTKINLRYKTAFATKQI